MSIAEQPTSQFLRDLADRSPAPGGGAAAALNAAQSAALLSMAARYSDSPDAEAVLDDAEQLRARALELADEDGLAFGAVANAYQLPREDKSARRTAIAAALAGAAQPPAEVAELTARLVELAERLEPVANRNLITDVAAAADCAHAAASTARLNVDVNLRGIADDTIRQSLQTRVDGVDDVIARADQLSARIRAEITS